MAYSETYCDFATGSNINAGDDKTISTTTNGAYTQGGGAGGTDLFTAASGTPFSTASVDDLIASYVDGATVATFIGRITAVNGGGASVDISLTKIAGTRPTTAANGRSATIGGKWKGPNAASGFPLNLATLAAITNTAGDIVSINLKNGTNYAITAVITMGAQGPYNVEGYTTTAHDGGIAIIDGGTSGASYNWMAVNGNNTRVANITCQNNGATGATNGIQVSGSDCQIYRVKVKNCRGTGLAMGSDNTMILCEAEACNQSNTSGLGGLSLNGGRAFCCYSHDNTGSNSHGFLLSAAGSLVGCISDTNGGINYKITSVADANVWFCSGYNSTGDMLTVSGASSTTVSIFGNIFTKSGGYFVNASGSTRLGTLSMNFFGAGTEGATSGNTNALSGIIDDGTNVTLTSNVSPFVDAANGNFNVNSTAGGGALVRGSAIITMLDGVNISYRDGGALQHQESASSGGGSIFGG